MATEIIEGIWIGSQADARTWGGTIICVQNKRPIDLPPTAHWVSVVDEQGKFSRAKLTAVAQLIHVIHDSPAVMHGQDPLAPDMAMIQDEFGQLQAVAVVCWYLNTVRSMEWPAIYELFEQKGHPIQ